MEIQINQSTWEFLNQRRDFGRLMVARHISVLGDHVHTVANMWLVQSLTGSALAMGSVFIAYTIPQILFSLIGGVSVDRYNRKRILIYSDILRAIGVFSLAILAFFDRLMVWHIALVAAFNGAAGAFFNPAVSASVPQMVDSDELQQANALNSMNVRVAGILGAALGGIIIAGFGAWGGYTIDSITYLLSAMLLFGIRIPTPEHQQKVVSSAGITGVWQDLKDGIFYIVSRRSLLALASLSVAMNVVAISIPVLLPSFAEVSLQLSDPTRYGFLWSGMTIGMFLGAILLNVHHNVPNKVLWIFVVSFLYGVAVLTMALSRWYLVALFSMVLMSFSMSISMLLSTTLYQTLVPKEYLGRFFANIGLFVLGLNPIIIWIAGFAADQFSAMTVLTTLSGFLLVFCLLWATQYVAIRRAIERLG
ncbi:MAG TPA: MFS transporter [Anaerolineales bacterium]|nr:MFS transporter [Anaerolineales bacterium]